MIVVEVNRVCSVWINLDCETRFRNLWRGAYTSTAWIARWFSCVRFWGTIAVKYRRAEMGLKHVRSRWGSLCVGGEQRGVTEQTWKRLGEKKRHTGSEICVYVCQTGYSSNSCHRKSGQSNCSLHRMQSTSWATTTTTTGVKSGACVRVCAKTALCRVIKSYCYMCLHTNTETTDKFTSLLHLQAE